MSILSTERLGHSYHDKWLFKDLHFALQRGERTALVGANGAGKSTLLGILSGAVEPSEGQVVCEKGTRLGHLKQNPDFEQFTTIADFIYSADHQQQQLIRRYEELVSDPLADAIKLAELSDELSAANAWEYEHTIKGILSRFQLTDLSQQIATLSGGQRKRLALAKLLIDEPDVYILDEPTNHLDIETIEWLEKWLVTGQKTVLLVTHDRYFLDNVCTSIYELEGGSLQRYSGNYSYYLEKRAERVAAAETALVKNRNLLRRELEWMRRQPQARATKSKARIDAFHELKDKTQQGNAQGSVQLSVKVSRLGGKIMELEEVAKSYEGKHVIRSFSYVFKKGDRIGLAGRNGSGKSTFLDLITKVTEPDSGTVAVGETVVFGYYRQTGLTVDTGARVIDVVKNVAEYITMANGDTLTAAQLLTLFLFPPEKQFGLVSKLSGGERKRLLLMRVLMKNPNVLILDEPANDLDIDTLNVLEEFLANYPGILLLVSHDRYLLDRLTDQLFIFDGMGEVICYNGNYAAFKAEQREAEQHAPKASPSKAVEKPAKPETKTKLTFREQREYELLDNEIPNLERQITEQTNQLAGETDYQSIAAMAETIDRLTQQLDAKTARWLALSEYV
ncbi:MAG TPA: ABC-F family ATP-binding cassette domain-containing protein [Parapedobacter sp.]|uniref:ABC-F family ATP-binding cassette domain-containing protein n=1 Tax=Parapedobacter sp. TaxID=1958893 RepID=UPI002C03F68E|nr:ABC-F family ATP-binding cassette domain-containing protein [Parapedobacter sp.]HWK58961.1 ABC-F family ATP-binding cassette domain-containing protein [Parapedobacter sp.]